MSDTVSVGSDHNPETENKEDSNNDKEIWKESLLDVEKGDKEEGEKKVDEREGEDEEKAPPGIKPELQYSRDELYEIQKTPLSQIKPEFLIDFPIQAKFSFVKGVWERSGEGAAPAARERWPRAVTPNEHDGYTDNKMRRGENTRSRGKDGQQDPNFILSPQRRSFNSGCYMTGSGTNNQMGVRDSKIMDRESMGQQSQARRNFGPLERGSSRGQPWSEPGTPESTTFVAPNLMPDYTQRRDTVPAQGQPGPMYERGRAYDSKYENKRVNNRTSGEYNNRSNGEYHRSNGGEYNRNGGDYTNRNNDYNNGRYNGMNGNDRRQRNNSERNHNHDMWDEPEWFAEPTTQNDVIELRGFYDDDREDSSPEKARDRQSSSTSESDRDQRKSSSSSSGGLEINSKEARPSSAEERSAQSGTHMKFGPQEPNLDDLLNNLDTLPDLLSNGTSAGADSTVGGSRFSRWFRKESPIPPDNKSPSPHHMINDLINDLTDENRPPPSHRFSPISPVFSSQPQQHRPLHSNSTSNFLDMMMKGTGGAGGIMRSGSVRDLEGAGKLHSVEELEAKMRPHNSHPASHHPGNKEEDMANFKKLLAKSIDSKKPPDAPESHLAANHGTSEHIEASSTDAMLPNMMTKLLQQQQLAQSLQQGVQQLPPSVAGPWGNLLAAQSSNNYQELVHKMVKIQQAQEYHRRMTSLGLANNHPTPGIPAELQHHLLNNPQFDARSLVRPSSGGGALSPNPSQPPLSHPLSPGGPNFLHPAGPMSGLVGQVPPTQAAQQFMMGATNPGAVGNPPGNSVFQHRIPSPNQLAAHTQSILQNAIMKKKLEEQKEALRKRQELMQRAASPGGPVHHLSQQGPNLLAQNEPRPSNPSPVISAFTPTSVLRKMTAHPHPQDQHEKDNMLLNQNHSLLGQGWPRPQSQPSSLAHKNNLINLGNQQIPGHNPLSNLRSKFSSQSSKPGTKPSGQMIQSVAEQMNIMSQEMNLKSPTQHTGNPFTTSYSHHSQSGGPQVMEQLEKWFSPELLARAQAQAPVPAQNILSVEELERLASRGHPASAPSAEAVQN